MPWFDEMIPENLTYNDEKGAALPLRGHQFVTESPDVAHFVKKSFDNHRELGSRIPVRKLDKPEDVELWRKEHLPKLYNAGLLKAPPGRVEDYNITRPEKMPDGLSWNEERAKKVAGIMHKHGVPVEAAPELLNIYTEALLESQFELKTSYDNGIAALKAEFGTDYEASVEDAKRLTKEIFKTPEELELFDKSGMSDHPAFLGPIMRLAKYAAMDTTMLPGGSARQGGTMTREEVLAEMNKIETDKSHPQHQNFLAQNQAYEAYVNSLYERVPGVKGTKVTFGQGASQNVG